jgi:radical SAM PhpK family P-methyltransferase
LSSKNKAIDCLLIGHNEMNFLEYEETVRKMGVTSGAYRDLNLNFIRCNNMPLTASDVFNVLCREDREGELQLPPLSLGETFSAAAAYLGTYLHRRGFTFDFINAFQDEKDQLARVLEQENILAVAITTTLYVSLFPVLEIMEFIKKHNTTAKVIIGGPYIATQVRIQDPLSVENLFKTMDADFYVDSAQGEAALVNILHALRTGSPVGPIKNIYYRGGAGYRSTLVEREDNDLSENMVDWELFAHRLGDYAGIRTSISCPFACSFCGFPKHAGEYRTAGLDALEREFNGLQKSAAIKHLHFIDDTFNVPPNRFKDILRLMIKNRYGFHWHSHFRCQFADREMMELMKQSGCEGVFLGIESGSNSILKNMNKGVTIEKYREGIRLLKEYGITTFGCFITGFPGETAETAKETVRFIRDSGLDFYRVQLWYCDPVTPIWQQREKYHITGAHFNWSHATMNWQEACDLIEEAFLTIETPLWVPQYNFEFDTLFHLLHRGLTWEQVKNFLNAFKNGVKEKLSKPGQKEAGFDVLQQLKTYRKNQQDASGSDDSKIADYQADFDF